MANASVGGRGLKSEKGDEYLGVVQLLNPMSWWSKCGKGILGGAGLQSSCCMKSLVVNNSIFHLTFGHFPDLPTRNELWLPPRSFYGLAVVKQITIMFRLLVWLEYSGHKYVISDLATDVTIIIGEVKFHLHKIVEQIKIIFRLLVWLEYSGRNFPLMSKSNRLQKLVLKASEENSDEIDMVDFPGGPKAFEICAKFCYGMTVTLNAYNVVAARCAAEYLEMTEDVDRGNLIFKIEVFINSSILRSWKDSIIVLQTTKSLLPWSENLKIVGRCIDSIASKTSVDPANVTWSYTYNRKLLAPEIIVKGGMKYQEKIESVPKDWWVEDVCELEIFLYKRVMTAVKSKGRMDGAIIGEALKTYAVRWLPDSVDALISDVHSWRNKLLVETIVCLLPSDKGVSCSCSFLLKLLKVAILVGVDDSAREDLMNRISLKLHEASVKDLLIPARSPQTTIYDVGMVHSIVNQCMINEKCSQDLDLGKNDVGCTDFVLGHGSLLSVGKVIDGYLEEIARDPNLSLASFIDLARSIPEFARPVHDGLYKAIDMYLKEHLSLTKAERKELCSLMDVKKLTMDASMHAAQNDRLPLRVVVQVLFFEQVRASAGVQSLNNNPRDASRSTTNTEEEWEKTAAEDCNSIKKQMNQTKIKESEFPKNGKFLKKDSRNSKSGMQLLPSRSRRIFDKLWVVGKGHGENKSSETSGSSQSPTSMVPGGYQVRGFICQTQEAFYFVDKDDSETITSVAILDGITMGCGGGISLPGMFRLVTDKTVFSHPETQLGFHPDAGASFYLSRLPGYLGEYLALTGDKLNERLGNLMNDDPAVIDSSLAQYGDLVYPDRSSILRRIDTIDKCFSHDTVEEIIDSLENEAAGAYDDWCKTVLRKMKEASPLSLKVTLRSLLFARYGKVDFNHLISVWHVNIGFPLPGSPNRSLMISLRLSLQGVRARLVDKDFAPKWYPASLEEVSKDMVEYYFTPLGELEPELVLPTSLREPYI
ncbi:hypothetical protein GOBAR_DD33199 [Gossypium barbadense]|nr:hypothetical protein GOBAR_DD33199 [Gossypium barbadense]